MADTPGPRFGAPGDTDGHRPPPPPTGPAPHGSPPPPPPGPPSPAPAWGGAPLTSPSSPAPAAGGWSSTPADTGGKQPPRSSGGRRLLAIVLAVLILGGGSIAAAVALVVFRSTDDSLTKAVPADVDFYGTVYINPSLQQKSNLSGLLHKFPDTPTDQQISDKIDNGLQDGLKGSGLSYRDDVKPWIGSQLAITGRAHQGKLDSGYEFAVMLASRDDGKATAALNKYRRGKDGGRYSWSQHSHNGTVVWVGTPGSTSDSGGSGSFSGTTPVAYAVDNHRVLVADSESFVGDLLDTAANKRDNLTSSADYKAVLAKLPSDRLTLVYVNAHALIQEAKASIPSGSSNGSSSGSSNGSSSGVGRGGLGGLDPSTLNQLDAYRGLGISVGATSTSIDADGVLTYDQSKLSPEQRAGLSTPAHRNQMLSATPEDAYGMLALSGFDHSVKQGLEQASKIPSAKDLIDQYGLNDPNGVVGHLTGDAGLFVGPGSGSTPGGAVLVGVNDKASAQRFLDKVGTAYAQAAASGSQPLTNPSDGSNGGGLTVPPLDNTVPAALTPAPAGAIPVNDPVIPSPAPSDQSPDTSTIALNTSTYKGIAITTYGSPTEPVTLSYAVTDKLMIVGSSDAQVKRVVDTLQGGSAISDSGNYKDAIHDQSNSGMAFVDIDRIAAAARDALDARQRADYDRNVAKYVKPLRSFAETSTANGDATTAHLSIRFH